MSPPPTLHLLRACVLVAFAALALPVHAALWGYVDGQGVAHFAHTRLDSRYQLVLGDAARREARVPGKTDSSAGMLTWLEIAPEVRVLKPWLHEAALAHGVDRELLTAVIAVESGFDAKAVSPRGARGLMQITPETAERYADARHAQLPLDERLLDPRANIHTGARMLADLIRRFGRIDVALAAWNAGEGTVRRHGGKVPPIDETRAHVHLVLELYWGLLQRSQNQRATQLKLHAPVTVAER
ncbi:MAG: lytic transglycosylase domain-containing protein [Burkholderiales bacterium]|nr:lytic transglycosylase domain-containing protein [Burkholderiales bacterium]